MRKNSKSTMVVKQENIGGQESILKNLSAKRGGIKS